MVVIRLARTGTKKKPFYHLSVVDKRSPRDGRFIERIGFYNPVARGGAEPFRVDLERIDYWSSVGAQISPKVASIVKKARKFAENSESVEGEVASSASDASVATPEVEASQAAVASGAEAETEAEAEVAADATTDTVAESGNESIDEQESSSSSEDRLDETAADEKKKETEE